MERRPPARYSVRVAKEYRSAWLARERRRAEEGAAFRRAALEALRGLGDLYRRHGVKEAWLFGSAARGTARAGSDVDLAVRGVRPGRYFRFWGEAARRLAWDLDVVDLAGLSPPECRYLLLGAIRVHP